MTKDNRFLNLLKSDFYKLSKSKSIIVCPIIMFALILLNFIVLWAGNSRLQDADPIIREMISIKNTLFAFSGQALIPICIAVTVSLFIGSDLSYGLTKNSIARGADRTEYFFSKFLTMATVSTLYTLFAFVITLILTGISFAIPDMYSGYTSFTGQDAGLVIRCLVLNIFMNITATAFFTGISFMCKKQSVGLGTNLGIYILGSFIITIFSMLSQDVQWLQEAIDFTPYNLQSLASSWELFNASESARVALMPLVYAAFGIGFGLLDFVKKDIN